MKTTMTWVVGTLVALTISIPAVAHSQERVGVATTVVGPVTITHVATSPAPLKFKDDVLLNDRVTTGDNGFARMLLGGKAIVTARERSIITITETPGVSTIDLVSGRISVAVDKSRVRPGEVVEIKTPNAVSGIRGTIVVAEVSGGVSTITVLRGLVDVYRRDPVTGNAVGPATPVGVRESVTVKAGVLPARPQRVSADNARRLSSDFTAPVRPVSPASTMPVADEVTRATDLIGTLTGGTPPANAGTPVTGGTPATTSTKATTSTLAPTTALAPTTTLTPTTALTPLPTLSTMPTLSTVPTISTAPTTPTVPKVALPPLTAPILPSNTLLK
jgi:hypothetical protein